LQGCDPLAVSESEGGEVLPELKLEALGECLEEHSTATTSSNEQLVQGECSGLINVGVLNPINMFED